MAPHERERERDVAAARTWQVFGREKGRDTNMRYYTRERSSVSLHVFMSGVVEMAVIYHADIRGYYVHSYHLSRLHICCVI